MKEWDVFVYSDMYGMRKAFNLHDLDEDGLVSLQEWITHFDSFEYDAESLEVGKDFDLHGSMR